MPSDSDLINRKIPIKDLQAGKLSEGSVLALDSITLAMLLMSGSVKVWSDGSIHWASSPKGTTYTWDTLAGYIQSMNGNLSNLYKYQAIDIGTLGTGDGLEDAAYYIEIHDHTLAGGALNNSPIVDKVAAKYLSAAWIIWSWDTAPGAAYGFAYHEEDQAADFWHTLVSGQNFSNKLWMYYKTASAVNKDIMANITGGAGAEKLRSIVAMRSFS